MCRWLNFLFSLFLFYPFVLSSFSLAVCLLVALPHIALDLYYLSWLVKWLVSVNLTHLLLLFMTFIFHFASGSAFSKGYRLYPYLSNLRTIHPRFVSLWLMVEHTVYNVSCNMTDLFTRGYKLIQPREVQIYHTSTHYCPALAEILGLFGDVLEESEQ